MKRSDLASLVLFAHEAEAGTQVLKPWRFTFPAILGKSDQQFCVLLHNQSLQSASVKTQRCTAWPAFWMHIVKF
jgi:hypothetical protein